MSTVVGPKVVEKWSSVELVWTIDMARGLSLLSYSLIFLEGVILLCVVLKYSPATALKCKVCGFTSGLSRGHPYNASCDAPEEMDCTNDSHAKEPYACAVGHQTDIETGNPTGKILNARCRIRGTGPLNCWLNTNGAERPLLCWCNEDLCEYPPSDIWEKAVKNATETIAEEKKEAERRRSSSAPPIMMHSTSWTSPLWTGMAPAIILIQSLK